MEEVAELDLGDVAITVSIGALESPRNLIVRQLRDFEHGLTHLLEEVPILSLVEYAIRVGVVLCEQLVYKLFHCLLIVLLGSHIF